LNTLKKCCKCNIEKELIDFSTDSLSCKKCKALQSKAYYKTKRGVISSIYNSQVTSSKVRKHPKPTYDKAGLTNWLGDQNFDELFTTWVNSRYSKELRPSVDRISSDYPYNYGNIRLITWAENNEAAYAERKLGRVTKQTKRVKQMMLNGNLVGAYANASLASRETGIQRSNISTCCRGATPNAGGYLWEFF
jgi:hypothetical protein